MLISLKFKNFFSYKDETQLLMTSVKAFKELQNSNVVKLREFDILKTAAIYGSNGGGKSNFIKAMGFMSRVIHNSFADSLKKEEDRLRYDRQFRLDANSEDSPTEIEVVFVRNGIIYRYGFHMLRDIIIREWLYQKREVETMLFERRNSQFDINANSFAEGNKYKKSVNANVLFLSYLAQNNAKVSSEVFDFFDNVNVVSALSNEHYEKVTKELLNSNPKFKIWLSYAVKFLKISNVEINTNDKILTYHNKFDSNNFVIDTVSFDLDSEESEGTKKLIYLLGAIYDTLQWGRILFIDEFDSKLHPNLSEKLIRFFHKYNQNRAQVILTLHDSNLLDKEIFRRDQIWFVDKNKVGSSEFYSLSEFDSSVVRSTSDFRKKYLELTFGAADSIEITKPLIDLMYDKTE